ncbi:MAG: hypothetical protein H6622_07150 [Halobacteriovoraceae bacterium]|nr:hypothetical protein [Halobacteriovoraceae bacterium]
MSHGDLSWDITVFSYHYLHYGHGNYLEYLLSLGYMGFGAGISISPKYFGEENNDELFYWFSYTHECNKMWSVDTQIGFRSFDVKSFNNGKDDSYMYFHFGVSRSFEEGLVANIKYIGTDLDSKYHDKNTTGKMVVSLTQTF